MCSKFSSKPTTSSGSQNMDIDANSKADVQNIVDDNDVDIGEQFDEDVSLHNVIGFISELSKRNSKVEF